LTLTVKVNTKITIDCSLELEYVRAVFKTKYVGLRNASFSFIRQYAKINKKDRNMSDFKPILVGLKGKSGCTLNTLEQASSNLPLDHEFRQFLPRVSPKRANTRNQVERTIYQMFADRSNDIRVLPRISLLEGGQVKIEAHVSGTDNHGKTLSAERYEAIVTWDDDHAQIIDISVSRGSGATDEGEQKLTEAIYQAEGMINSTQWIKAWETLHGTHKSYDFKGNVYLIRTAEALADFTAWKTIANQCGLWCWRADEPIDLIAIDLEEKMKNLLTEAQGKMQTNQKVSGVTFNRRANEIEETVDFINQLRATMGLIADHLDPLIEQTKQAWTNLESGVKAQQHDYITLSEQGQAFLKEARQHELYPFKDMAEGVIVGILNRIADNGENGLLVEELNTESDSWTFIAENGMAVTTTR
jgi:hypothetical protein